MKNPRRLLLLLFLHVCLFSSTLSDLAADRSALLRLRAAVLGRTARWNVTDSSPCLWEGITCEVSSHRVIAVRLPGDRLSGQLPLGTVGGISELRILSLRGNRLFGPLPSDLAQCSQLTDLHLQGNLFSGEIPASFFILTNLERLNMAGNNFSGDLSSEFNRLSRLKTLYLENNGFTGSLPDFPAPVNLRQFNVSFTSLSGSIPSSLRNFTAQSFIGTSLCGGPLVSCPSPPNDSNHLSVGKIAGIVVGSLIGFLLFIILLFILLRKCRSKKTSSSSPVERSPMPLSPVKPLEKETWNPKPIAAAEETVEPNAEFSRQRSSLGRSNMVISDIQSDGLVFFGDDVRVFALTELLKSSAEVYGKGTVGSTYKAYLHNGVEVIVKRLRNVCLSERDFRAKIEDVGSMIHEHLLPLRGYFFGKDEKLLVYEPVPNGSLYALLHGNNKQTLSWEIRVKIALEAARGIEYLHSISPGTTHGNIKSSNVFLTNYYNVLVSEFGITQLVSSSSNTNGYRAPEVIDSRKISQPADVYSFGVLLLELLTSKFPDNALTEEGIILPNWVQSVVQERWTIEVFDPQLLEYENLEEKMVQLLHLAISCTSPHPDKRPSMAKVASRISELCGERS